MGYTSKGTGTRLRSKIFSPLYLAIMIVAVIIVGNLFNWADVVYGTHLNAFNPLLVILTVVFFSMYIYRVWKSV